MTTALQKHWTIRFRNQHQELAESLAVATAQRNLPIPLSALAKRRGVSAIEFRPLPVDGLLGFVDGAFRIFLHAEDGKAAMALQRALEFESDQNPLPPRTRFTLAHELAHTFLFEIRNGKPTLKTDEGLATIEPFCNAVAASFLMPRELFRELIVQMDLRSPAALRKLCQTAAVSPPALIYRLSPVSDWVHESVAFLCIRNDGTGFKVEHVVAESRIALAYPQLRPGYPCKKLVPDENFVWNGGCDCETRRSFKLSGTSSVEEWTVRCEPIRRRFDTYLVTVVRP